MKIWTTNTSIVDLRNAINLGIERGYCTAANIESMIEQENARQAPRVTVLSMLRGKHTRARKADEKREETAS